LTGSRIDHPIPIVEIPRQRFELGCGAVLLVSPRLGAPVTAVRAHIRGGPSLDPLGKEGQAYLTGALCDQGTEGHDEQELASLLEPAGGDVSGDANGISGSIAGDSWRLLLDLMAEMLTSATFPAEEVDLHKRRLLTRLAIERDDPRAQGRRRFRKLVYGDHWLGRAPYGDIESVERLTPEDLRAHREAYWCGRRTYFAVCGDVDAIQVRDHLDGLLAGWNPGTAFAPAAPHFPERAVRADVFWASRQQVHIHLGHLGVVRTHPDYPALVVMDHILGTGPGFTNRISRRLRDELGLAYAVSADIHSSSGVLPGTFTAYIGTSPEHVKTATEGFLHEMRLIREEPVSAEELSTAKSYLFGSMALGFERAMRRAGHLISAEIYGFPEDALERLAASFEAVTIEDVQRVAAEHLYPGRCCLAAAGPTSTAELLPLLTSA